jgi:hypothetical protein
MIELLLILYKLNSFNIIEDDLLVNILRILK